MEFTLKFNETYLTIDTEKGTYTKKRPSLCVPTIEVKRLGELNAFAEYVKNCPGFRTDDAPVTTRRQMQDLMEGDVFYVDGEKHTASCNAGLCGDASCDEYVVYDENGEGWFESDFPKTA